MVGQQGVFSFTGSFCGRPTTMKVLPRINLHFNLFFRISSKINKVDLALESTSFNGCSKDCECDGCPAR